MCVVLGYPLAYLLARSTSRIMALGLFLLIMPLMVSTVIRVFGWVVILGSEGLVNQALRLLGAGEGVRLLYTEGAVILGLTQQSMPFMVLPIMAAIERISPSLEEAAQNLGASWAQMFARIIVPLSMPGLVSGALLVFSVSMSAFITPALMGGRQVRMVGQQIYEEVLTAYDWPGAASLTIVLSALMLGAGGPGPVGHAAPGPAGDGPAMTGRAPRFLWPFAIAVYALLLAPLVVVIAVSFGSTATFDFPPKGLSLRWYQAFFASETFVRSFFRVSQVIGLWTALVATVVGALAAIGLVRFRFRGRQAIETFFLSPLLVPHILLGAAVYLYLARLAWPTSSLTLAGRSHRHRHALRDPLRDGRPGRDGPPAGRGGDEPGGQPGAGVRQGDPAPAPVEPGDGRGVRLHHLVQRHQPGALPRRGRRAQPPGAHLRADPVRGRSVDRRRLGAADSSSSAGSSSWCSGCSASG